MTCPICGKAQPCVHSRTNSSAVIGSEAGEHGLEVSAEASPAPVAGGSGQPSNEPAWRREVTSRVQQHRARRRKSGDANALELDFSTEEPYSFAADPQEYRLPPPPERYTEIVIRQDAPKVIRFPRPVITPQPAVQEVRLDELSDPMAEAPRILEAQEEEGGFFENDFLVETEPEPPGPAAPAEQMQLLPSFADIHLEPEASLDEDLDPIPHPAPLRQRAIAGLVDSAFVLMGSCIFMLTFLELAEEAPKSRLTMVCALAVGGMFWLVFQYLFLIHGRRTPGMKLAQLELCTFEEGPAPLFARQCRALASTLSGIAIGLGYLWVFIDEDRLGWHDRISQTYLKGSDQTTAIGIQPYCD